MLVFRKVILRLVVLVVLAVSVVSGAQSQDLLVASQGTNSIKRYNASTGAYVDNFISAGSGGLTTPRNIAIGPLDSNVYVSSSGTNSVKRYSGRTGAYIGDFITGRSHADVMQFGPDGNLYVASNRDSQVYRYNGTTGASMGGFLSGGGVYEVTGFTWGPDGTMYVSSRSDTDSLKRILRYNGTTGAFIDVFRSFAGEPGDNGYPGNIKFGPDGNLYVVKPYAQRVERLDKTTGLTTAMTSGHGGELSTPSGLTFGPDANLYVNSVDYNQVCRFNGTTLAYINRFVPQASNGGLSTPIGLVFRNSPGTDWVRTHPFTLFTWLRQSVFNQAQYGACGLNSLLSGDTSHVSIAAANGWTLHFSLWADSLTQAVIDKVNAVSSPTDDNAWQIWDEPGSTQLPGIGAVATWLRSNRPNSLIYLNVTNPDSTYLASVMTTVKPDVLMYDMYPFYTGNRAVVHGPADIHEFITLLMMFTRKAKEYGVPCFSWMQTFESVADDWRAPSESELRMQIFASLTAGVKGLGYFCYEPWTPGSGVVFEKAMLKTDLTPDAWYHYAQNANPEILKLAPVLLSLESSEARFVPGYTGSTPHSPFVDGYFTLTNWSAGAGGISEITNVAIDSGQSGALKDGLIGFFSDDAAHKYFMLTNLYCDPTLGPSQTPLSFTVTFNASTTKVYRLSRQTGLLEEVTLDANHKLRLTLPGGTGDLFTVTMPTQLPGNSIQGTIQLQDYNPALPMKTSVRIDLIRDGSIMRTENVLIDSTGNYAVNQISPSGTYDVAFKAASWLRTTIRGLQVPSGGTVPGVNVSLVNGDVDGDNELTSADLSIMLTHMGVSGD
jgi:hypothetical protein